MMKLAPKLNNEQLEYYLLKLVEKIVQEHKLQLTMEQKKTLVGHITQVMMENGEFSREHVIDKNPEFMHKLSLAVVAATQMNNIEKLMDGIRSIFSKNGINKLEDLNKNKLENKLTPAELKQLKHLQDKIKDTLLKADELKLIKLPRPKPGGKPEIREEDINSIILGLSNPKFAGSFPRPVSFFVGNLYGIPDLNPYNGTAPLDQNNKITTELGDSFGVKNSAKEHFESIGGSIVNQVHAEISRPTLTVPGTK